MKKYDAIQKEEFLEEINYFSKEFKFENVLDLTNIREFYKKDSKIEELFDFPSRVKQTKLLNGNCFFLQFEDTKRTIVIFINPDRLLDDDTDNENLLVLVGNTLLPAVIPNLEVVFKENSTTHLTTSLTESKFLVDFAISLKRLVTTNFDSALKNSLNKESLDLLNTIKEFDNALALLKSDLFKLDNLFIEEGLLNKITFKNRKEDPKSSLNKLLSMYQESEEKYYLNNLFSEKLFKSLRENLKDQKNITVKLRKYFRDEIIPNLKGNFIDNLYTPLNSNLLPYSKNLLTNKKVITSNNKTTILKLSDTSVMLKYTTDIGFLIRTTYSSLHYSIHPIKSSTNIDFENNISNFRHVFNSITLNNVIVIEDIEPDILNLVVNLLNLKVPVSVVRLIINLKETFENNKDLYSYHKIKTPTKIREIYAPNKELKSISKNILKDLNRMYYKKLNPLFNDHQFAYLKEKNIVKNAKIHQNNNYILNLDISSFFDSCNWTLSSKYLKFGNYQFEKFREAVYDQNSKYRRFSIDNFSGLDTSELIRFDTSYLFKLSLKLDKLLSNTFKLAFINPNTKGLYQGNPVSGTLSNLILNKVTKYMKNIFNNKNIEFSIYSDDITLSSSKPINRKYAINTIMFALEEYNMDTYFILKEEKTRNRSNNRRKVTGIRINHKSEITVPRNKYNKLKVALHKISQNKLDEVLFKSNNELLGLLNFCDYVDESNKINRLTQKYEDVIKDLKERKINLNNQKLNNKQDSVQEETLEYEDYIL